MNRQISFTIICGLLLASLAVPAAAQAEFQGIQDLVIPEVNGVATDDTIIVISTPASTTEPISIGVNTKTSTSTGTLKAQVIIDTNYDNLFTDADSKIDWTSALGQKYFIAKDGNNIAQEQTKIKLSVTGDTAGSVFLYTNEGTQIDTSLNADKSAKVTIGIGIPEFPTVALPVAGILGLLFIFGRKKEGL